MYPTGVALRRHRQVRDDWLYSAQVRGWGVGRSSSGLLRSQPGERLCPREAAHHLVSSSTRTDCAKQRWQVGRVSGDHLAHGVLVGEAVRHAQVERLA